MSPASIPNPPASPARAPSRQDRSRRTAERILAAALDLLGTQRIDELTVARIAERARVSIGGFYARFPGGKEGLFEYLGEEVFEAIVSRARQELSAEATRGLGAREVVERYVDLGVGAFRRNRRVLQQVSLRSRTSLDASFRERVLALNVELHDLFRSRLRERIAALAHPDPELAISLALTAMSGAMREYVLFQELRPQFEPIEDERLVGELTDLVCHYLRIAP